MLRPERSPTPDVGILRSTPLELTTSGSGITDLSHLRTAIERYNLRDRSRCCRRATESGGKPQRLQFRKKGAVASNVSSVPLVLMFGLLVTAAFADKNVATSKAAGSIAELRQQIERTLQDSHTPGVSVAIVHRSGPEWVAGLGKSNVAASHAATEETLFRIASVSKSFVSLSILKLSSEGKLSLQDPVRKLVPEIWFENRWEATDPVRVVDLLEHTAGWDEMHQREVATNAKGMTLREGLNHSDRQSRISRCSRNPHVAYTRLRAACRHHISLKRLQASALKIMSGKNFFQPIGMKTATYLEQPSPRLTALYHRDGHTPYPYWNLLLRPASAINASAKDMAAYLQFYLNPGRGGRDADHANALH